MPRFESAPGFTPPSEPHLGFQHTLGAFTAVGPGAAVAIIEDPKNAEKVWLMLLTKVNHNFIEMKCACGRPRCTRTVRFKAIWKGQHIRLGEK